MCQMQNSLHIKFIVSKHGICQSVEFLMILRMDLVYFLILFMI